MKILIGTKNKGKIAKFANFLNDLGIEYITPYDIPEIVNIKIDETGTTTQENAIIKAKAYYDICKIPVLCDDSSLIIDKFPADKQPGVFVHRHDGKELTDSEILDLYSAELEAIGGESPGAFIKTLCIIDEKGKIYCKDFRSERYFVSKRSNDIVENFPLRSLIYYKEYGKYMSEMSVQEAEKAEGNTTINEKEFIKSVLC
ncbi:MAG: hypothetical protein E7311_00980 [Clostridiales bacterium]|nr:hypothetical protein [Clostridiales bacterium]